MKKLIFIILGILLLLLGFIVGINYNKKENSNKTGSFTTSQIVSQLQKSEIFQYLMQEGLNVKETKNTITFYSDVYQLEVTKEDSILIIPMTLSFDSAMATLLYDTLGMLSGYNEGDTYKTFMNIEEYSLSNDGLEYSYNNNTVKIDISKPIISKSSTESELTEYVNIIKDEYYQINHADEIEKLSKKNYAIEEIQMFAATIKLKYYESLYINNTNQTFEQLLKDSSDSSSPTNCTGSINNGDVILKDCIIDTFVCSYNITEAICE
jgi:hypothetical protein